MLLILFVVFAAVFATIVLVTAAAGGRSTPPAKVRATLESVLVTRSGPVREEVVDVRKRSALSSILWLDKLLARMRPVAELRRILEQADLPWTPGRVIIMGLGAWMAVGYIINSQTDAGLLSVVFAFPVTAAPFLYVLHKRQVRFRLFLRKLPDAIDLMVSALRAGNSTMGALGVLASDAPEPIRREFRTCFDEQSYGVEMRSAMESLAARVPLPDVRIITTAIMIQKESGGNLAEVLDKTAEVVRDRFRVQEQIRVHTAQGRITGAILTAMPVGIAIILSILNPGYLAILFKHPLGHKMLAAGAVMNVIGWLVIRKIIRIEI
jgi:tight adherence protein B